MSNNLDLKPRLLFRHEVKSGEEKTMVVRRVRPLNESDVYDRSNGYRIEFDVESFWEDNVEKRVVAPAVCWVITFPR
jgi:hypothetical protein